MRKAPSALVSLVAGLAVGHSAIAQDLRMARVRSDSPAITALIREASRLSTTFAGLIDTIDDSDGLVYVDEGRCPQHFPACLIHAVQIAGPHRVLHIKIDPRLSWANGSSGDAASMGLLGHELQHAVEVLANPRLRTSAAIVSFFMREGTFTSGRTIETVAAERAGIKIENEVRQARKKHPD